MFQSTESNPTPVVAKIVVSGELDAAAATALRTVLQRAPQRSVELDMSGVDFMGCSALRVLLDIDAALRRDDGRLTIVSASRSVTRLLAIAGLDRFENAQSPAVLTLPAA